MASADYALSELLAETWDHRLTRVCIETRDLIADTRKMIDSSRLAIREADRLLERTTV